MDVNVNETAIVSGADVYVLGRKGKDGREWEINQETQTWRYKDEGGDWIVTDERAIPVSVKTVSMNDSGHLLVTNTEDETFDVGYVRGPEGPPMRYEDLTNAQKDELAQHVTLQGGRIKAVDPGALPAGPVGQTRYMEVTAVGTWTFGGVDIGSNADGYETTFWWDGTAWSNNGSVKVKGDKGDNGQGFLPYYSEEILKPDFTGFVYNAQVRDDNNVIYISKVDNNTFPLNDATKWDIASGIDDNYINIINATTDKYDVVSITAKHFKSPDFGKKYMLEPEFEGVDLVGKSVRSVKIIGKNKLSNKTTDWEIGTFNASGETSSSTNRLRLKVINPILPSTTYVFNRQADYVVLYDSLGNPTRALKDNISFTTTANEVGFRVAFWITGETGAPNPQIIEDLKIQMEIGATPSIYERYSERVINYKSNSLKKIGSYADRIIGSNLHRKIATGNNSVVINGNNVTFGPSLYYTDTARLRAVTTAFFTDNNILTGRDGAGFGVSNEGNFPIITSPTEDIMSISLDGASLYVKVPKAKIADTTNTTAKNYMNANPITLSYVYANERVENVLNKAIYIPKGATVIVDADFDEYKLHWKEVNASSNNNIDTSYYATIADRDNLQAQINALVLSSGSSNPEVAQARVNLFGQSFATLNERLNEMQKKSFVTPYNFGAVGDGVTDDTNAVMQMGEFAHANRMVMLIPRGIFLCRRTLYVSDGMTVLGEKGGILKKNAAVTQLLTVGITTGQTVIPVPDGSKFVVGQDVMIAPSDELQFNSNPSRITDIDGDNITIVGYRTPGVEFSYASNVVISSTFPQIAYKSTDVVGLKGYDITIDNVTFDGNKQVGEPKNYPLANIHFDPHTSGRLWVVNNTILNSASDGISIQSSEESFVLYNRVNNTEGNGMHIGFTITRTLVLGNMVNNAKNRGLFWCYNVDDTIVLGNFFTNCWKGCAGIESEEGHFIISANIFNNNTLYDVEIYTDIKGNGFVTGNIFKNNNGSSVYVRLCRDLTISNNMFAKCKGKAIELRGVSNNTVAYNNIYDHEGANAIHMINDAGFCTKNRVNNNFVQGCTSYPILLQGVKDSQFVMNTTDTAFTHSVNMLGTNDNVKFIYNEFDKPIIKLGTRIYEKKAEAILDSVTSEFVQVDTSVANGVVSFESSTTDFS